MAAAVVVAAASVAEPFLSRVVTGSGLTASTAYILTATHPSGAKQRIEVTTDGAGGFTFPFVFQERGNVTFAIRPRAEWEGSTTAAATASKQVH
jgi:S1-C subfamily serine protease